jgi:hypothetical protein
VGSIEGRAAMRLRERARLPQLAVATFAVTVPLAVAACGSGGASTTGGGALAKAPMAVCQQLNGVLSDGPDPTADPVGYALSQIRPLAGIHTSDGAVATTVGKLDSADQTLVRTNGRDSSAKADITQAFKKLNQACPGVAP